MWGIAHCHVTVYVDYVRVDINIILSLYYHILSIWCPKLIHMYTDIWNNTDDRLSKTDKLPNTACSKEILFFVIQRIYKQMSSMI